MAIESIQFREATAADVPAMAQCRLADPSDNVADPRMAAYFDRQHHPQQALPPRVGYVALANHAVIGYIAGHRTTRHGCAGEVQYLFVAPAYRHQGVATALLRLLAKWFQAQAAQKVCVGVANDSPPEARPFFERAGAIPLKRNWYAWDDIGVVLRGGEFSSETPPARDLSGHLVPCMILLLILFTCVAGAAQTRKAAPMPQIQTIGEAVVWRISDNKDQHGRLLPPWKEVKITNVFGFKKKPVIGNNVTIVPLDSDVAPLDLKITEIKERKECGSHWWEVELEPVNEKKFFEVAPGPNRAQEFPFDVSVIYPSVKSANQLNRDVLRQNMLPKGITLDTVKAAIDLTNDGIPDVLMVKYCCSNPKKAAEGCDYTCGKTFKKIGNVWKLIDSSAPC